MRRTFLFAISAISLSYGLVGCSGGPAKDNSTTKAPKGLRDKVIAALKRDGSKINLDDSDWVLGGDFQSPEAQPLLWNGFVGLRFPTSNPKRAIQSFHSFDFTDSNKGTGSHVTLGRDDTITGGDYFALDMKHGILLSVDSAKATEYQFGAGAGASFTIIAHALDGSAPAYISSAGIQAGLNDPSLIPRQLTLPDWDTDIQVTGPREDQVAIRSMLFYLRSSEPQFPPHRPSPMSLSSTTYDGHTFWDADVWYMPALAFIDPRQGFLDGFAKYRSKTIQPNGPPYSWESATTGKELAPAAMQREIHISADVLWGLNFSRALGVQVPKWPELLKRVASYYESQLSPRPGEPEIYDLKHVVSPDENHTGDNDLYTNMMVQWVFDQAGVKKNLFLPRDKESFLTYENDPVRSYKQAAALLTVFPLQNPEAQSQARTMLERFQDKVIPNGPAMSESIHATIWARLGEADKAYEHWQKSWQPYMKGPLMLFSEKKNSDRTYFTTGAAGALQTVIYGFLGFRVDKNPDPRAAWTKKLLNGMWLSISPHLPSAWSAATFKNFSVLGHRYTLTVQRINGEMKVTVK